MLAIAATLNTVVGGSAAQPASPRIERVTTVAPYPRGLAMVDDQLLVLCRGRVRTAGGVSAAVDDQAGTIYAVDPNVTEPIGDGPVSAAVRANGTVFARPTTPPFRLWDRASTPPQADRNTDRPYCTLRHHAPTQSLYLCAFSGIDKRQTPSDRVAFSKNLTDAVLRYDLRTRRWYEVERHDIEAGGSYPHHDPRYHEPPHGWLNGPDNCLPLGRGLYAVSKDNGRLVHYDLSALESDPDAGAPPSRTVMGTRTYVSNDKGWCELEGQSALAFHDGWLYVGYRTSSVVVRLELDANFLPVEPIRTELVARFDPYDPVTGDSADITDMAIDTQGRLYVLCAQPARVYRLAPDPVVIFDGRAGRAAPWVHLAEATDNSRMKSENILVHENSLYVTSGDGYGDDTGAHGTVYRVAIPD